MTTEHTLTTAELSEIMSGRDGADLELAGASGMRLVDVTPGSIAARLGGRNGDIIASINGVALTSAAAGYQAARDGVAAKRLVLAGSRDGERFVTTIVIA